jgi:ribonuclease T1
MSRSSRGVAAAAVRPIRAGSWVRRVAAIGLVAVGAMTGCGSTADTDAAVKERSGGVDITMPSLVVPSSRPSNSDTAESPNSPPESRAPASIRFSDLDTISLDELPPEALDTLALIDDGGPFPYRKDGSTFQNRENRLPRQSRGYYREYTVETPGEDDRGARRIVAGDDGDRYYTDDHYDSFREIIS